MSRSFDPKKAIILFTFLIVIIPFYNSKKIILWNAGKENFHKNLFNSLLLSYANFSEDVKKNLRINGFFEKEHDFWLKFKTSPVVFSKIREVSQPKEEKEKRASSTPLKKATTTQVESTSSAQEKATSARQYTTSPREVILPKEAIKISENEPLKILLIGDSMMAVGGGLGDVLEREVLKYQGTEVFREGKVSSGLSRPDYFNWELTIHQILVQFKAKIVIVMIGINDAQALTTPEGQVVVNYASFGTKKWDEEYSKRVDKILEVFQKNEIIVFWIGLPVMRNPNLSKKMAHLNSIYEKEVGKFENAYFIPSWNLFSDEDGNYINYQIDERGIKRLTRTSDGIHFQYFGGNILVKKILKELEKITNFKKELGDFPILVCSEKIILLDKVFCKN